MIVAVLEAHAGLQARPARHLSHHRRWICACSEPAADLAAAAALVSSLSGQPLPPANGVLRRSGALWGSVRPVGHAGCTIEGGRQARLHRGGRARRCVRRRRETWRERPDGLVRQRRSATISAPWSRRSPHRGRQSRRDGDRRDLGRAWADGSKMRPIPRVRLAGEARDGECGSFAISRAVAESSADAARRESDAPTPHDKPEGCGSMPSYLDLSLIVGNSRLGATRHAAWVHARNPGDRVVDRRGRGRRLPLPLPAALT